MKQIRFVFSLALFAVSVCSAFAVDIYKKLEQITEPTALIGKKVFLQSATTPADKESFHASNGFTANAPVDSAIFIVEAGEPINGMATYYFKNEKTGNYMAFPKNFHNLMIGTESAQVAGSPDKSMAVAWFIGKLVEDAEANDSPFQFVMSTNQDHQGNYSRKNENTFVVTAANAQFTPTNENTKFLWLSSWWGNSRSQLSFFKDTNLTNFYEAGGLDGQSALDRAVNAVGGSTMNVEEKYVLGETVGKVPAGQEGVIEAFKQAFQAAIDASGESTGDEEKIKLADKLIETYNALQAVLIPFKEGYYNIKVAGSDRGNNTFIYENSDTVLKLTRNAAEIAPTDARYIFHVTKREGGGYKIQNMATKRYIFGVNQNFRNVTTTVNADTAIYITVRQDNVYKIQSAYTKIDNGNYLEFHASGENNVVIWKNDSPTGPSSFMFEPVDASVLENASKKATLNAYNDSIKAYYLKAVRLLNKSQIFTSNAPKGNEETSNARDFSVEGLVTDTAKIWSNADHNALEGNPTADGIGKEALIDGIVFKSDSANNFMHTSWKATHNVKAYHYFAFDLGAKQTAVEIKLARRPAQGNNNPIIMEVYGANELDAENVDSTKWTYIGALGNLFKNQNDSVALGSLQLSKNEGEGYQYLRFDVTKTHNGGGQHGFPFTALGEFRIYAATYDANASQFSKIANNEAYAAAVASIRPYFYGAKLEDPAIWTNFKAQYDQFLAGFADYSTIEAEYNKALALYNNSEEDDTKPGYFATGSKETFKTAIDGIKAEVTPETATPETVKAVVEKMKQAVAEFQTKLKLPATNEWFMIRSKTRGATTNPFQYATASFVYAQINPDGIKVKWTGRDTLDPENLEGYVTEEVDKRLNFFWRLVPVEGEDSLKLQNFATGLYLKNNMQFDETGSKLKCVYVKSPGVFAFQFDNGKYINAEPGSRNVVTWGEAGVLDNSSFAIIPATEDKISTSEEYVAPNKPDGKPHFVTLPYGTVSYGGAKGEAFSVLGLNKSRTALVLAKTDNADFEAGETFVFIPKESTEKEDSTLTFFIKNTDEIAVKPVSRVGLIGVYNTKVVRQPEYGALIGEKIVSTKSAYPIPTYSAYVGTEVIPSDAEENASVKTIAIEGTITNIKNATILSGSEVVDVYTLDGKLVKKAVKVAQSTKGLPAGVYVVGKTKVVVE